MEKRVHTDVVHSVVTNTYLKYLNTSQNTPVKLSIEIPFKYQILYQYLNTDQKYLNTGSV